MEILRALLKGLNSIFAGLFGQSLSQTYSASQTDPPSETNDETPSIYHGTSSDTAYRIRESNCEQQLKPASQTYPTSETDDDIPWLTVYHGTSNDAAVSIRSSNNFIPSSTGLYGSTNYFSENIEKAEQFGPVVLICEVDKRACQIYPERGNICCVDNWHAAQGKIVGSKIMRYCSRNNPCKFTECRGCRTQEERSVFKQQQWEYTKVPCPGTRSSSCVGRGYKAPSSKFCRDCREYLYG